MSARLAAVLAILVLAATPAWAQAPKKATGSLVDEVLLRPQRLTSQGRNAYDTGDYPKAQERFDGAAKARPDDPRTVFNQADALFKAGKLDEATELYRALAVDERSPLAGMARYNLGNALLQKQSYPDAVKAYREALHLMPSDADTRRNLEIALRALKEQEQKQKQQQQQQDQQNKDEQEQDQQKADQQKQNQQQNQQRPKTDEEKEQERWKNETGMPKERAMQLLSALQQSEKEEQKKQLAALRAAKKKGKDW